MDDIDRQIAELDSRIADLKIEVDSAKEVASRWEQIWRSTIEMRDQLAEIRRLQKRPTP